MICLWQGGLSLIGLRKKAIAYDPQACNYSWWPNVDGFGYQWEDDMSHAHSLDKTSGSVRDIYWLAIAGLWSLLIFGLCAFAIVQSKTGIMKSALLEAKTNLDKDLAYRRWSSEQGGIYIVPTEKAPPNPYLNVPDRDVLTADGMHLTLVNPAYMTRLVHESSSRLYGVRGHLTSLNPIRPENKPDMWEASALKEIEKGINEVTVPAVEIDT